MDVDENAPSVRRYQGVCAPVLEERDRLRMLLADLLTCASYTPGHVSEDIVRRAREALSGE